MKGTAKASNQWMVDLAASARQEVMSWPAWKQASFGVSITASINTTRPGKSKLLPPNGVNEPKKSSI